jgi:membrane-associated phospholipid phosphatase
VTFLVYPVAPPWLGVNATRVLFQVDGDIGLPVYRTIFDFVQANPFAAFPSLHAAYPWLISLFAFEIKRAKALPILIFPVGVWLSAVYLGEHYIVDIISGIAYATIAFLLVEKIIPQLFSLNAPMHSVRHK